MKPSSSSDVLLIERRGAVTWLTLNRPDKCNALDTHLNQALIDACASIDRDTTVVALRGAGKHFCAGSDLLDLYRVDRKEATRVVQLEIQACQALAALPQLTVAVLHGKCLGGGAVVPLYCDLRVGYPGVEFRMPEVPLGWLPPYGIERMASTFRRSFLLDVVLSGRACGDQEALMQGWLTHLVKSEAEVNQHIEALSQIQPGTLSDSLAFITPKENSAIAASDAAALEIFLNHFQTNHAQNKIAGFVEKKRS